MLQCLRLCKLIICGVYDIWGKLIFQQVGMDLN